MLFLKKTNNRLASAFWGFFLLYFLVTIDTKAQIDFIEPKSYFCQLTNEQIIVDGKDDEKIWTETPWTDKFININDTGEIPFHDTQVKMLWDEEYFYFFTKMEEPHVWAKLTDRDAVIFYDNDFEIFIDPDADTHFYYEFEVNALNTVWDLLLTRPYRDGAKAIDSWDIQGLKTAVYIEGSVNNPNDEDTFWTVEVAMPWKVLEEMNSTGRPPKVNDVWRVNFSRVQWETEVVDGKYVKKKDPETGKNLPEHNWTWSRQRAIAMHEPEFWGLVKFVENGRNESTFEVDLLEEEIRQTLYHIHRAQIQYKRENGKYSNQKADLLAYSEYSFGEKIFWEVEAKPHKYEATIQHPNNAQILWHIDETGRNWKETKKDE